MSEKASWTKRPLDLCGQKCSNIEQRKDRSKINDSGFPHRQNLELHIYKKVAKSFSFPKDSLCPIYQRSKSQKKLYVLFGKKISRSKQSEEVQVDIQSLHYNPFLEKEKLPQI
jgi:hypothetical protein